MRYFISAVLVLYFCESIVAEYVNYHLHVRGGDRELSNLNSLQYESLFKWDKPTVFVVHGWLGSVVVDPFIPNVVKAFLNKGDYNVIGVKWSASKSLSYDYSCNHVPEVGHQIAGDINRGLLNAPGHDYSADKITLVGYSLGAHVVGIAGIKLQGISDYRSKIGRVVGVDPARINYRNKGPYDRISTESGSLVEIIHADAIMALNEPLGHVDFFVNGGSSQPGCIIDLGCNHDMANFYYVEALERPGSFVGTRCNSYDEFLNGRCSGSVRATIGADYKLDWNHQAGKYYLQTNDRSPFGLGMRGASPVRGRDIIREAFTNNDLLEILHDIFNPFRI